MAVAVRTLYAALGACLVVLTALGTCAKAFPTVGQVFSLVMASRFGRWAVLFGWWWLGWHFFVRRT